MRFAENSKEGTPVPDFFIIFRVKLIISINSGNEKLYTMGINNEIIHGTCMHSYNNNIIIVYNMVTI